MIVQVSLVLLATFLTVVSGQVTSCIQCSQENEKNCSINPQSLTATACSYAPTECYTMLNGDSGKISRGCLNTLSQGEQLYCKSADDGENCVTCQANGCNQAIFPTNRLKCHQCDSRFDQNCKIPKSDATYCEDHSPYNQCITLISHDKGVTRVCTSSPQDFCANAVTCARCPNDGCNDERITISRLQQLDKCPPPVVQPNSTTSTTTTTTTSSTTTTTTRSTPTATPTPSTPKPSGVERITPGIFLVILAVPILKFLN
ncbi:hypothetical protein DMENIID0001_066300 [Sergentomyia squamirostris]